ncbi:type II toxin-antitoxin system HicB family antitoxin [Planctomycetota bacterium]
MRESDRYLKIVEWSDEDVCYVGTCPELMLGGVHGDDETAVFQELRQVVDEWVAHIRASGQPLPVGVAGRDYSGKFVLRVESDLHKTLSIRALQAGKSLNSFCKELLQRGVSSA